MKFYITTPIYYVSDAPHIGHAYTTIVADALARYHRLRGHHTRLLTGTDDHGQKIARLAEARGVTPREYADKFADVYRATWKALEISNDDFIRTTDPDHEATVQDLWRAMEKNGAIYLGDYEGWYCVACEQFYTEKELGAGLSCPVHQIPVEKVKEKSFYFRLSHYRERLLKLYDEHPEFVQPDFRRNEVRAFVAGEVRDLSISRTTFKWGVPVPGHPGHVIYVWLDALTNYYSATRRAALRGFWDEDAQIVHLIGKEISRFHAVYWPAFLMAAGWRLPTTVFAHGWWTVDGEKISKTRGNVVDPLKLGEDLGVDAVRYFLMRETPLGADGDFSHPALLTRYNAELANDLGNLLSRTLGMVDKYFAGGPIAGVSDELKQQAETACAQLASAMDQFAPALALERIWRLVRDGNTYIDQTGPWNTPQARRAVILWNALEALRFISNVVEPFMPERAAEMRRQLGVDALARWPVWGEHGEFLPLKGAALFPRVDEQRRAALLERWVARPPSPAGAQTAQTQISYDQFQKLDLRVGEVVEAEPVPKAKKLLKLMVDVGGARRQVVAGIAERYRPADLVGRKVILVANLQPATIRGVVSEGMVLAAGEDEVLALAALDGDVPSGTKVR